MISETATNAIFLVIVYDENEFNLLQKIDSIINNLNKNYGLKITVKIIDATRLKPSASKLPENHEFRFK